MSITPTVPASVVPFIKLVSENAEVCDNNPLPVTITNADSIPPPAGAATSALQETANTSLASIATNTAAGLTDTQLRASPVAVSGAFYQVTQPISGTVTANAGTNLNTSLLALEGGGNLASIKTNTDKIPAQGQATMAASTPVVIASNQSAVPISGAVTVSSGSITVANASLAVTGTFWQATQPISGAVSFTAPQHVIVDSSAALAVTGPLTDVELRASAVDVAATNANLELTQGSASSGAVGPMVQGAVSETTSPYIDGELRPLSLNSEGRLRVTTVPAYVDFDFFGSTFDFGKPANIWTGPVSQSNPWGF